MFKRKSFVFADLSSERAHIAPRSSLRRRRMRSAPSLTSFRERIEEHCNALPGRLAQAIAGAN
jgi:hypothetical protein